MLQVKVQGWGPMAKRSFCPDLLCEFEKCFPSLSFSFNFFLTKDVCLGLYWPPKFSVWEVCGFGGDGE